jgi:hypothetical protein
LAGKHIGKRTRRKNSKSVDHGRQQKAAMVQLGELFQLSSFCACCYPLANGIEATYGSQTYSFRILPVIMTPNHTSPNPFFAMSYAKYIIFICAIMLLPLQATQAAPAPLEKLLGARQTKDGLTVTVVTGGCTKKSDFEIITRHRKRNTVVIELHRVTSDDCKGNFPEGIKMNFSRKELKVGNNSKITLRNEIEKPAHVSKHPARN